MARYYRRYSGQRSIYWESATIHIRDKDGKLTEFTTTGIPTVEF